MAKLSAVQWQIFDFDYGAKHDYFFGRSISLIAIGLMSLVLHVRFEQGYCATSVKQVAVDDDCGLHWCFQYRSF